MACYNVAMAALSISLLGRFAVQLDDRPLKAFRTKSVAALLIVLASETGETNSLRREWLTELLWPEQPAGAGRKNLRQSLYELRQAIPEVGGRKKTASPHPFVLADRQTIQLNGDCDYRVDTAEFEALLATDEIDALRRAVELYQGDFLSDFYLPDSSAFEDWAAAKRALYHRLALDALERLAQHNLQRGDYEQAAGFARRQLTMDGLREKALQQVMVSLAMSGRRSEALAHYEQSRQELQQELGLDPEPATLAIYDRIASGEIHPAGEDILGLLLPGEATSLPALEEDAAPAAAPDQPAPTDNNLPAEPTQFVGRRQEVLDVAGQVLDPTCRLLTILGPGGCGKSRLAIQVGRRLLQEHPDRYPDGVWYASLAKPVDAGGLVSALVDDLPFKAFDLASGLRSQLVSYLERRQTLLLLDNMEYVQGTEGLRFLSELLDGAPGVTLLACSRSRLNLHAEQLFPIVGLEVPRETAGGDRLLALSPEESLRYSALQLFTNSARRVRPGFELTDDNIDPAVSICRQLQGIPLAIELAASWLEVMSPAEVAAEVARCLDFLEADWVDLPERQRSLKSVFETSWRLLDGPERAAFLRLSVFRGGFDYESARQVTDANHRTLLGLLNKSWLQRDESGRYLAHEMLRQYAYQRLADDVVAWQPAHDRHSDYFTELMYAQGELLKGPQQVAATERIEVELQNITAAWEWLVEQGRYEALIDQMLPGLFLYTAARSRGQRLVSLVAHAQRQLESGPELAKPAWQVILLTAKASYFNEFLISRYFIAEAYPPIGQEHIGAAYAIAHEHGLEDRLGIWSVMLAMLYGWAFDQAAAIAWLHRLVETHRAGDDKWLMAVTLENLGGLLLPSGLGRPGGQAGTAEADRYLAEAVSLFEHLGDRREKGYTLKLRGLLNRKGDFSDAKRMLLTAQNDLETAGDPVMAIQIMMFLAEVCVLRGEISEGFDYYQRVRHESARLGNHHFEAGALSWESQMALRLDTVDHARETRQESLAVAKKTGDEINFAWGTWELGEIERVAGNYDKARALFEESRHLLATLEDPYAPAFLERGLGDLAHDLGRNEESLRHFEESLRLAKQVSHQWSVAYAYFGLGRAALALAKDGQENRVSQAQNHVFEGLHSAYYHRYREQYSIGVTGLADCYAASGQVEKALRMIQIVLASPLTWQETRKRAEEVQATILANRPVLANTQGSELADIQSLMQELLDTT